MLIGTDPDQVPTNADLGELAYLDANYVLPSAGGTVTGAINLTASSGYNIYASGAAPNYLAGSLGIGSTSLTGYSIRIGKAATGNVDSVGVLITSQINSDVTASFVGYQTQLTTQAASFTTSSVYHFLANALELGASSSVVSNQFGFVSESSLTTAINNYAFRGNIAAAAGKVRYNLYMAGTADNYLAGSLGVGTASPNASAILDVQSTTKGVRMPNMTSTQKNAISSPAAGLMVFDTTLSKLCVYSGAAWQTITSV
jgi:hypothetical protein